MRRQGYLRARDLCVLFILGSLVVGASVYTVGQLTPSPLIDQLTPEHLAYYPEIETVNSQAKIRGYQVTLVSLGLCWIAGAWLYRSAPRSVQWKPLVAIGRGIDSFGGSRAGLALVAGLIALASTSPWGKVWYWGLLFASIVIAVFLYRARAILAGRDYGKIALSFALLYALFFCVPGLLGAPDLTHCDMAGLADIEWHMSTTVGLGDRYAAGHRVFRDFIPHHGYIFPPLNGLAQSALGYFSLGDQMRLIRWLQVLFAVLTVAAYRLWKPGRPWLILAGLLLVMPELSGFGWPVYQPNSSGWRFLTLPIGVMALLLCRDGTSGRIAPILGAWSGFSILFLPETGLALTVGNCMFLGCRTEGGNSRALLKSLGWFLSGLVLAWVAYLTIFRVVAGYWPVPEALDQAMFLAMRNLSGYTGTQLKLDPLPWLIFSHSAYIVMKSSMQWRNRPLSFQTSFRAAIAAILLVWFVYWINRSDRIHLWTHVFLYSFLVDVLWDSFRVHLTMERLSRAAFLWRPLFVVMILLPHILAVNYMEARTVAGNIYRMGSGRPSDAIMVSGVWLKSDIGRVVLERAEFVRRTAAVQSVLYLTGDSYLIPKLSGAPPRLPSQEVFAETVTKEDYRRLLSRIFQLCPDEILFDAPDADEYRASFYGRIKKDVSELYERTGETSGWQVWKRKRPSCDKEGSGAGAEGNSRRSIDALESFHELPRPRLMAIYLKIENWWDRRLACPERTGKTPVPTKPRAISVITFENWSSRDTATAAVGALSGGPPMSWYGVRAN